MIIKYVHLRNIRSYVDEKIEFPSSRLILSGGIGSGKSSILMSLVFALFSPIPNDVSNNAILRHGAKSGYIELCFDVGGKEIIIRRNLSRKKSKIQQDAGKIIVDGVEHDSSAKQIKAFVLNELGYPSDFLNKKHIDIFQFTVFSPQEKIKQIIRDNAQNRKKILNSVFDIDRYRNVKNIGELVTTDINAKIKELKRIKQGVDEDRENLETTKNALIKLKEKVISVIKNIDKADNKIQKIKKDLSSLQADIQKLISLEESLRSNKDLLNNLKIQITQNTNNLDKYERNLTNFKLNLKTRRSEIKDVKKDEKIIRKSLKNNELRVQDINEELGKLKQRIADLTQILNEGTCATCEQEVQDISAFNSKIELKKANFDKLVKEKDEIIQKIADDKNLLEEINSNKVIENEIKNISQNIQLNEENLTSSKEIIKDLNEKMNNKNIKQKEIISKIELMKGLREKQEPLQNDLDKLQEHQKRLISTRSELEEKGRIYKVNIKNYESIIKRKEHAEKDTIHLSEISTWLKDHYFNILERMENQASSSIYFDFNYLFQDWFNIIMQDEQTEVQLDSDFTPIITQNGYDTSFEENLSGGEGTSVALAYRLALNNVINNQKEDIKTKDLIILDEPTTGFSRDQLKRVRDVFNKLNARQLIVVSHEPEVEGFVDQVIHIEKRNNISKIKK